MNPNPYESPGRFDSGRFGWRRFWKRTCLASLGAAVVLMLSSTILATLGEGENDPVWFSVLVGLLALGELTSLTLGGVAGIGWTLSRKSEPQVNRAPEAESP